MPLTSSAGRAGKLTLMSVRGSVSNSSSGPITRRPGLRRGERHRVAHALARIGLAERDRPHARQRALHRGRHRARIGHVLGKVRAAVDARQDHVGRRVLHDVRQREHHCVGRSSADREASLVVAAQPHRRGQRQRMAGARLLLGRRDDPDVVAELACDRSSRLKPRAFTPSSLVIRIRTRTAYAGAALMLQPRTRNKKLRHIRNSLAISSRRSRRFLLRVSRAIIGRSWGLPTLPDKSRESQPICLRLHRWPGRSQAAAFGFPEGVREPVRGRDIWRLHLSTFTAATISNHSTGSSFRKAIARRKTKNSCAASTAPISFGSSRRGRRRSSRNRARPWRSSR